MRLIVNIQENRMKRLISLLLLASYFVLTPLMAEPVQVNMETSQGDIVLELYPDKAPKTVANFLQYVEDGFYSNTIFHRVIDNFMIQGGGFDNNYMRKQTRAPILNEADNGLKNELGTIAMARTMDPHSATAQFFINVKDNDFLNHSNKTPRGWGYAVFGKVIKGMQTVDKIRQIPTGKGGPFPSDVPQIMVTIKSMSVVSTAKPQDKK
jgi:cyclophilin family peptidyl-prolyl cis-trans isomerase